VPRRLLKPLAVLAVLACAVAAGYLALAASVEPLPEHPFWKASGPRVIAHRGGRGLWPENTLYAFRNAYARGADVLEMDLRETADGEIVVLHDATVDRTTDASGPVAALTVAQLQRLDAGYRWTTDAGKSFPFRGLGIVVPTLRQVFDALPGARMNLEMKGPGTEMAAPLCKLIRAHAMTERVAVAAFAQEPMDAFRAACPDVATAATRDEVVRFVRLNWLYLGALFSPRAQALQIPERLGQHEVLTPLLVHDAQRLGIKLEIWTVNDPSDMRRLLAVPVDGIITDYPDRLLALLRR